MHLDGTVTSSVSPETLEFISFNPNPAWTVVMVLIGPDDRAGDVGVYTVPACGPMHAVALARAEFLAALGETGVRNPRLLHPVLITRNACEDRLENLAKATSDPKTMRQMTAKAINLR